MKKIIVNTSDRKYEFICESRSTRYGFAHDCTLIINDTLFHKKCSCYYLNRTWEHWNYQSVCLKAINELINDRMSVLLRVFKSDNDYKKMTKQRYDKFNNTLKNDCYYQSYINCKKQLIDNCY